MHCVDAHAKDASVCLTIICINTDRATTANICASAAQAIDGCMRYVLHAEVQNDKRKKAGMYKNAANNPLFPGCKYTIRKVPLPTQCCYVPAVSVLHMLWVTEQLVQSKEPTALHV
jgi:hypothetical protein